MAQQSLATLTSTWCCILEVCINIINYGEILLYMSTLTGITVDRAVKDGYRRYFDEIDKYLEDKSNGWYTREGYTNVAIKLSIKPPGESSVDIDFILSPYFKDNEELLQVLTRVEPPSMRLKM